MRAHRPWLAALLVVAAATSAFAKDAGAPALGVPACVEVKTESRYVPYGYNHVVVFKNGCSKSATCAVSTDVNPEIMKTDVAVSATVEVLTFSGSPSQTFVAKASCTLAR